MNKAWLVRGYNGEWEIYFEQPESWHAEVKEIAWIELKEVKPE